MERESKRHVVVLSLLIVVGFSAYLRLLGITWGLNSGYGHYLNFHPDEFISIRGMLPIELRAGKLQAPDAYFEGTFNYYLWAVPKTLYELCSHARPVIEQNMSAEQFKFVLLSGRLMSVAFDLATVLLLFLIVREVTGKAAAGILAALVYGVIPIQVIYSHFMRTYSLSNFLCALVIWFSIKVLRRRYWLLFFITGVVAGLATATRYPAGAVIGIPCALVLFQRHASNEPWRHRFGTSLMYLLSGPLWLLSAGFVFGLFVGEPMLFLNFRSVVHEISFEMSHYAPAGARNPFDLKPLWRYTSILIPYATYPLLWLLIYISTVYVILRRCLWPTVVPLCLFAALYTYAMAKGYLAAYARLTMLLMPVFCMFVGLAFGGILPKLMKRPLLCRLVIILMLLLLLPSVLFDWAYGRAMSQRDVRELLRNDVRELIKDRPATTIAVSEGGYYFYTAMPAVFPLKSGNVAVQLESAATTPADFFVVGFERPLAENSRDATIRRIESAEKYRFVEMRSRAPSIFGKSFDLSKFPPDMTYPFPTIFVFRKLTEP